MSIRAKSNVIFLALAFVLFTLLASHALAFPDNRYCLSGNVPSFGATTDGPANLPKACFYTAMAATPSSHGIITVSSGQSLQTALNNAVCGDVIELQAGATFQGPIKVPAKNCSATNWITVTTTARASLPPEGTRLTPCYSGVGALAGRPALNCASTKVVTAKIEATAPSVITFAPGANHYRFIGLEVTRPVGTGVVTALITLAGANHLIFDRMWIHGTAHDDTTRGIASSGSNYFAALDSYINDFHCESKTGSCVDSQAISGGAGSAAQGVYKIVDNFLESAAEGIIFGGSAATTTPHDIEVRRNHFFKPMNWMIGSSNFIGGVNGNPFIVKNHFELKNGVRVLFEGNITDNVWGGYSQVGYSIVLTPKNPNGQCPLCQVTDVTVRYSASSHSGAGMMLANAPSDSGQDALDGERYSVHDVTFDDISSTKYYGGGGVLFEIANWFTTSTLRNVYIKHVTGFPDPSRVSFSIGDTSATMSNVQIDNNLILTGQYPVWSTGGTTNCAYYDVPITTIKACFTNSSFIDNAMIATPAAFPASSWPATTLFPSSPSTVKFATYNGGNGGDYRLCHGAGNPVASCTGASPYVKAGSDGLDLGANVSLIKTYTSGVY